MSDTFQATVLSALTGLTRNVDELRAGLDGVRADLNEVKADLNEVKADQHELRTELNGRIDDLRDRQTQMRVDIMHRMEVMQDALTAIRGDITVNNATAFAAREVNEHTRDEVRTLAAVLNGVQLQVQRLQSEVQILQGGAR
jgi:chromosome segregation ATPase